MRRLTLFATVSSAFAASTLFHFDFTSFHDNTPNVITHSARRVGEDRLCVQAGLSDAYVSLLVGVRGGRRDILCTLQRGDG